MELFYSLYSKLFKITYESFKYWQNEGQMIYKKASERQMTTIS